MLSKHEVDMATILTRLFEEESVSIPLIFRLSDMQPEEMEQFVARWGNVPDERRAEIARHMADISEENFEVDFSPAFGILLQDESAKVRRAALDGLWDSTNLNLVRPIMNLTTADDNREVRAAATRTLAHYVLMGEWGQIPRAVKERIVEWLVGLHGDEAVEPDVRRAALEALGPADHHAVPRFIKTAYESPDIEMQVSALFAMGASADPAWLSVILEEMHSPFPELRREATRAAGEIGRSDAVSQLATRLLEDDDHEVCGAAAIALGKIGGDRARHILERCRRDPDFDFLHPTIDEALDEIDWLNVELDWSADADDDVWF